MILSHASTCDSFCCPLAKFAVCLVLPVLPAACGKTVVLWSLHPSTKHYAVQADVWSTLQEVVERAWVLWELILLAQPLLVLAPSPSRCLLFFEVDSEAPSQIKFLLFHHNPQQH